MWYCIRRKSDNKYLTKFKLSFWESTEWSLDIELAEQVVIGRCEMFTRKFSEQDDFDIIQL